MYLLGVKQFILDYLYLSVLIRGTLGDRACHPTDLGALSQSVLLGDRTKG